jgi:uncharacterized protein YbbC (DUF1343 family)
VVSAYNLTTEELTEALRSHKIDSVLVDMQDVGVRLYTYIWTMYKVMNALSNLGKEDGFSPKFIVTDRPNPNGGLLVDGPMLNMSFASGYGRVPIPYLHGMTIGELASYFNSVLVNPLKDISFIRMENWSREMLFSDTGLAWVPPSPNLPTVFSAFSYPATVFIEATTISEGRGTCLPFTMFGAPFFSAHSLANTLNELFQCVSPSPSCFRAAYYQPTYQKYNNTMIEGVQLVERTTNNKNKQNKQNQQKLVLRDFSSAVNLLKTLKSLSEDPTAFQWDGSWFGHPGTELVDQYAGTDQLRIMIDQEFSTEEIVRYFTPEREAFVKEVRKQYLLY